jgi:hypothetical protein
MPTRVRVGDATPMSFVELTAQAPVVAEKPVKAAAKGDTGDKAEKKPAKAEKKPAKAKKPVVEE